MTKYRPGNLVYITDDKKAVCFRVLSEELFSKNPPIVLEQDPLIRVISSWPFSKLPKSFMSKNGKYEECVSTWDANIVGNDNWLGRTPDLPSIGMFLERILVKTDNKTRHMAVILGFDRKFIVPLHLLSPATHENNLDNLVESDEST